MSSSRLPRLQRKRTLLEAQWGHVVSVEEDSERKLKSRKLFLRTLFSVQKTLFDSNRRITFDFQRLQQFRPDEKLSEIISQSKEKEKKALQAVHQEISRLESEIECIKRQTLPEDHARLKLQLQTQLASQQALERFVTSPEPLMALDFETMGRIVPRRFLDVVPEARFRLISISGVGGLLDPGSDQVESFYALCAIEQISVACDKDGKEIGISLTENPEASFADLITQVDPSQTRVAQMFSKNDYVVECWDCGRLAAVLPLWEEVDFEKKRILWRDHERKKLPTIVRQVLDSSFDVLSDFDQETTEKAGSIDPNDIFFSFDIRVDDITRGDFWALERILEDSI